MVAISESGFNLTFLLAFTNVTILSMLSFPWASFHWWTLKVATLKLMFLFPWNHKNLIFVVFWTCCIFWPGFGCWAFQISFFHVFTCFGKILMQKLGKKSSLYWCILGFLWCCFSIVHDNFSGKNVRKVVILPKIHYPMNGEIHSHLDFFWITMTSSE